MSIYLFGKYENVQKKFNLIKIMKLGFFFFFFLLKTKKKDVG